MRRRCVLTRTVLEHLLLSENSSAHLAVHTAHVFAMTWSTECKVYHPYSGRAILRLQRVTLHISPAGAGCESLEEV